MKIYELVDGLHLLQSVLFVAAGFIFPPQSLPGFLVLAIVMLARFHDSCTFSEISVVLRELLDGDYDDSKSYAESVQGFWFSIGAPMTKQSISTINATLVGCSALVGLYRFVKFRGARFDSGNKHVFRLMLLLVCFAFVSEILIHWHRIYDNCDLENRTNPAFKFLLDP